MATPPETSPFPLERRFAQEMMEHARSEAPNECCGILAGEGGRVVHLYRAANAEKDPFRYNVDPKELYVIYTDLEKKGWELLGIYHSHTHTEAYPSATDVKLAFWPEALYFIVSLWEPKQPIVRAFRIANGEIKEQPLQITEDSL